MSPRVRRVLTVEFLAGPRLEVESHPGCKAAVHGGALSVIDSEGEIGGYADGVWRRWWYAEEVDA